MRRRFVFTVSFILAACVITGGAVTAQASPGNLKILLDGNDMSSLDPGLVGAIQAEPGVSTVDTFDSSTGTITPSALATYDLVIDTGDSTYADSTAYGNELATYLNAGGALIQFAYDNWDNVGASPTGSFVTGGYAPFVVGPNQNSATSLGTILDSSSPLLAGITTLNTSDNTTDALAPGATLLAKWADGRNAIATKGRVESVTASLDDGSFSPLSTVARLVVNAGNTLGRHKLTVARTGKGTVTSSPTGIQCGTTCSADFGFGQSVTLTAKPASGYSGSLSGGGCTGKATCTITLNATTTVTAKFKIKKRPHDTRITKSTVNAKAGAASFRFTASGAVTKFQCALQSVKSGQKIARPKFSTCKSPKSYTHLKSGQYRFEVRAVNSAGPDRHPAVRMFTIARPAAKTTPTLTG